MAILIAGLLFAVFLFLFLLGFRGTLNRSKNKGLAVLAFLIWVALAASLAILVNPLFALFPLFAHIPTLFIYQFSRDTPIGYWSDIADMGAVAVLSFAYFAIVWFVISIILEP